jgi:hypothetical protein
MKLNINVIALVCHHLQLNVHAYTVQRDAIAHALMLVHAVVCVLNHVQFVPVQYVHQLLTHVCVTGNVHLVVHVSVFKTTVIVHALAIVQAIAQVHPHAMLDHHHVNVTKQYQKIAL